MYADGTGSEALPYTSSDLTDGTLCSTLNSINGGTDVYMQPGGFPVTTGSVKSGSDISEISAEKIEGYDVKLTGLDPGSTYVIRYATGEYENAEDVKNGENAGFIHVSGVSEAALTLPTDGLHTITAYADGVREYFGTVTIEQSDIEKQFTASSDDLSVRIENLKGAEELTLTNNGRVVLRRFEPSFVTDGLKMWIDLYVPGPGEYTVSIFYSDGAVTEGSLTVTVPGSAVTTNGRVFTLSGYEANDVRYIRFARGVYTKNSQLKAAEDLRSFGAKYFTSETAAFAVLDAQSGETAVYTVQVTYTSGYNEFITFEITPTVPEINATSDSIILSNVQTEDYYIDWVRCAPGVQTTLYRIRHVKGSQVRLTENIVDGTITFGDLSAGTYTLYYLYDGWNLSEGMITVTVN